MDTLGFTAKDFHPDRGLDYNYIGARSGLYLLLEMSRLCLGCSGGSVVKKKNPTPMGGDLGLILPVRRSPGEGNEPTCVILAWEMLWTEEPIEGYRLQRTGHNLVTGNTQGFCFVFRQKTKFTWKPEHSQYYQLFISEIIKSFFFKIVLGI